ncbi:hypothetical protein BGZ60DRAFT_513871 [Tricladium varicosporioides]|nr:hypothetical protein BGZ60DRAFT_513871 [Hymenoscyphus varicosporioides]
MSTNQENKAIRERLILCKKWIYNLYINGVKIDGIQRALVHKRDPWINRGQIEYMIVTWKKDKTPQSWPLEQPQRRPDFIVPPPPEMHGHWSLPASLYPPQPQPGPRLHRSEEPRSFMPTSTMGTGYATGTGFPMASQPQTGFFSPYYTPQDRQQQQFQSQNPPIMNSHSTFPSTSAYQLPSQEASNANPPPQSVEPDAEGDAEYESVCIYCNKITGMGCSCSPAFF